MAWMLSNRLFFTAIILSGFSALVYQLVWVRLLGLVFGVSSLAVATVVAVFLLGIGLGSWLFGRWSERTRDPLRTYLFVELGIAVLSLLCYVVIEELPLYRAVYEQAYNHLDFYGMSLVRLLLSMLVLLPPVVLIGGTLPLVSKYFLTVPAAFGSGFSKVYYLNTLGAFAGALLTGFVLVQYLGVFVTLLVAVAGNLAVVALIVAGRTESAPGREPPREEHSPHSYMLGVLFLTGFISLGYEMLWARILSTYGLSTSQAFSLIVAGFLLGFSTGSFVVSRVIDRRRDLEGLFGTVCILTALGGAAVLFLFQRFDAATALLGHALSLDALTASLALSFIVSFVPAVFMGILFPLGLAIYARDIGRIGAKAGNILLANTAGCVLGSLVAGFVLVPFAGMWNTTLVLVNLSLLVALVMLLRRGAAGLPRWGFLLAACLAANVLVFSDSKSFHKEMKGLEVIYYAEGLTGTVTALEAPGYRGLFVDGQNVSGTDPVLLADSKMLAHLPLLLHDDPRVALTVGYGTGTTSGSMLLHGIEVHAAEIEEKILEAAPLFSSVNRDSYADPRLDVVLDDARSYIDLTDTRFDVIATDVTNLKYKRNPYLYTREYFRIMQDALTEDGIGAAWLPVGGLSFEDLRTLIATFDQVYPHTTVWFFTPFPTHFVILLGTPAEATVDLGRLERRMQKVAADLGSIHLENVYQLGSMLLLGEQDVDALVAGARLHTDDRPVLEFSDMRQYMMVDVAPNLGRLMDYQREDLLAYFTGTPDQLELLRGHFRQYQALFRNYVREYEHNADPDYD